MIPGPAPAPAPDECMVFELRQYTLKPGRRDDLIAVFERAFVEGQEAEGMCIVGTFADLGDDDRFVWVRGFRDMDERLTALTAFYGGPVWRAGSAEANDTMVDVSDVLLLRPLGAVSFPDPPASPRPITATVVPVDGDAHEDVADRLVRSAESAEWLATFATLHAENTFPALPIREDVDVVVVLAAGQSAIRGDRQIRLAPTARSRVR